MESQKKPKWGLSYDGGFTCRFHSFLVDQQMVKSWLKVTSFKLNKSSETFFLAKKYKSQKVKSKIQDYFRSSKNQRKRVKKRQKESKWIKLSQMSQNVSKMSQNESKTSQNSQNQQKSANSKTCTKIEPF